ncbi:alginate export family protein [Pseudomonas sp. LRF_L74]|uniref:alginate export family protein n=1 Tax=Pseudomonas sp. LRF_L74 TaxID=3369422 RepID=UPI003F626B6D
MKLNRITLGLGLGMTLLSSSSVWAVQLTDQNFGLDIKITAQSEDDRDLGTANGGDVNGIGLDLRPWVYGQRGNWSAYAMGQAVTATDIVETDTIESSDVGDSGSSNDARQADKSYLALREFWIDYAGLTEYPGEHLRFGRQRVRSNDGTWWDTNIEALRWSLDTTLLKANVGIAQRFSDYRTDLDELAPEDEDRQHLFGDASVQWTPGHWVGVKLQHSHDSGSLAKPGEEVDSLDKRYTGDLTWLGLNVDGDFFNPKSKNPLNYWGQVSWLTGDTDQLEQVVVDDQRIATGKRNQDVSAWAVDLGLRYSLDEQWKVGGAYARGSGGGNDGKSKQYMQTGLESNRSSFTGVESRLHRFGEAFRGELSNLQVASAFTSWKPNENYDASLVYHRFWRVNGNQDVGDSGITAALEDGSKDIGQEVDLVVTRYFNQGLVSPGMAEHLDDKSALVRFRGGVFKPGNAYASGTDSLMHRAFVDFIWRF